MLFVFDFLIRAFRASIRLLRYLAALPHKK